ncbi:MAG: polymerase [Spirochaetes bacterium GWD1_61_31]|nr:MAG: polymerase [Spirochaetes bacterium GWB1_60_80]OHD28533.1 MAG: polymerase [Spirochaetes bacterium GWC1_61_12]OHD42197.1 MAG: polymerase [Spirochaetes bacterium GWD1_61_31]OHD44527.1 MAG: polymerase [Spirochaetes bacterium GWE1_60_18]OHD59321.1 MAG: polymerase [Spirochaetes bacterium GWF1_60_12]HAP43183.1 polymerase [Spirochaetaceae bacterium]
MASRIGMEAVRELMRRYLDEDGEKRTIEADGLTLEEALESASVQLECSIGRLEYEIQERGAAGFAGFGKKKWKITAHETASKKKVEAVKTEDFSLDLDDVADALPIIKDKDGQAYVRLANEGALLKIAPPVGRGKKVTEKRAVEKLHMRAVHDFDEAYVREMVKAANGEWARVGSFIANPAADALLTVDVGAQDMEARVILTPPQPGGSDLSGDTIRAYLRNSKVVFGVLEDAIQELEDAPRYKEPVLVAAGQKPQNGQDASIQFFFETDKTKLHLEEKNGKVDYKELQLVQNVMEGQPLAKKMPAKQGVAGRTVTGKVLAAKNGKDIPMPVGKNVKVSNDGLTMLAEVNGEANFLNNKINVETVYTINGDIDLKTGNKFFLGTIIVLGNVADGFSVKATGNIEIKGNVGKAEISAEGDIVVHQGITGKGGGSITAGKNVWAKFIENANVVASDSVIATQSIVNSEIVADKRIICFGGKNSTIVGGRYRACEEISSKIIGSPTGGAETLLEVGTDPKSKSRLDELDAKIKQFEKVIDELEKNISVLNDMKKQRKTLTEEKEALLGDFMLKKQDADAELEAMRAEYNSILSYLNNLKVKGKVSVSGKIYPGTKITIKDIREEIKNEHKAITFFLENMMIKTTKYQEPDEDFLKKGPGDVH